MRNRYLLMFFLAASIAAKKKNPDDFTQNLALPKEPPQVAVGETGKLVFHVSPLSGKGLLSQQTRDALKAIMKANGGVPVVHIRAFVAGSGDIRRIPQIVSEVFTEKKLPLPSVSVILIGGLRLENAQVVLEAVSLAKKDVNPGGLEFVAGEPSTASDPAVSPQPLLEKTLAQLASRVNPAAVVQVSCFVSTMTSPAELTAAVSVRFPSAAVDLVQTQRAPWQALANCEVVVRGGKATAAKLAFTGTRVAFGRQEKDATLAFQRLDRDLNDVLAPAANIVFSNVYTLSPQAGAMVKKIRPAAATLPVEGLASIEAGFAVDAIAVVSP